MRVSRIGSSCDNSGGFMRDTKGCGEETSPLFRGDRARGAGNGEVPRSEGPPPQGQGVTGRGASAIGGRPSPHLGSAPSRDALGAEPLGKCPVPSRFIQRISGTGH